MAFDWQQSTFANSFFPTYKRQASAGGGSGNDGNVAQPFIPNFILPEQDTASYVPWSKNAHDDPYELVHCVQNNMKSRNPTDGTECEGETDLHGLVSNILEEANSQDSYYTEGNFSTFKPLWSPKVMRTDLLQYFKSEPNTQHSPAFLPDYTHSESFNKVQGQPTDKDIEEFCQQFSAFGADQQWLFTPLNGDADSYTPQSQKLPPGLPLSSMGDPYLSQMKQSKNDYIPDVKDTVNSGPVNNFPDISEVFAPQNEMSSRCFDPYYDDHPVRSSIKPVGNEQYTSQEMNKLVSSFQALMAGEQESLRFREPPNRQTVEMPCEDSMAEEWKFTSTAMPVYSAPTMKIQKDQVGDFGAAQRERNGAVRNRTFQGGSNFQDVPGFSPQNTEHFQGPQPFSATFNPPNQYQNKMPTHRGNTVVPGNVSKNQYSQHHSQQSQLQNKIKPPRANFRPPSTSSFFSQSVPEFVLQRSHQMQRGKLCSQDYSHGGGPTIHYQPGQGQVGTSLHSVRRKDGESGVQLEKNRMRMGGFQGEDFPSRAHANPHMKEQDKKQRFPQNPNFDPVGNIQSLQTFGGGNMPIGAGNAPQFMPFMYPVNDPTKRSCLPFNSSNLSSRSSLPYGPVMDRGGKIPDKEFAASNPYLSDMMGCSGDSIHPAMASGFRPPRMMKNRGGSRGEAASQLHFYLEECYEQWRCLEKERKKTESTITKTFPGKRTAAVTSTTLPRMPPNPTRVDHLIVTQIREQARVVSLLGKMERLRSIPFSANIHSTLDRHYMAICVTQTRRKEELGNMSKGQRQGGAHFREDRDTVLLAVALKDLYAATRKTRTALWCALQMTLPRPVKALEQHDDREATSAGSSSKKSSYTYTLA